MNQSIDARIVKARAAQQWREILMHIGLPEESLTKRNKPCPVCGGTDRFSFIDDNRGAFICRGLDRQGGDGFALVMHYLGCDFYTAVRVVAKYLGFDNSSQKIITTRPSTETKPMETSPPKLSDNGGILAMWNKGKPLTQSDPATVYLSRRGLAQPKTTELRFIHTLNYWHEKQIAGRCPAMLARVTGHNGDFVGLHRTYLNFGGDKANLRDKHGNPLPAKKLSTIRPQVMKGAAVQLFAPQAGKLALTEGIETALAVNQGSQLPVWACVSAYGLEHITPPPEVTDVYIFADNDANQTGQRAANRLFRRLKRTGFIVRVFIPDLIGEDWWDVFKRSQAILNGV